MKNQPKTYTPQQALAKLQQLCSRSEKCISDVQLKLKHWGIDDSEIATIVNKLLLSGFIDEQRYANAYVYEKIAISKWGIQKVKNMLAIKKIPASTINQALENIVSDSYQDNLVSLLTKKSMAIKAKNRDDLKTKLIRFALSRGFEYNLTLHAVNQAIQKTSENTGT